MIHEYGAYSSPFRLPAVGSTVVMEAPIDWGSVEALHAPSERCELLVTSQPDRQVARVILQKARARAVGPTRPTSRLARASNLTRPTRSTNHKLLANPSHKHKRLLINCRCCYFLIFRYLLIVVLVIYSLLKMAAKKGTCRNRKWSKSGRLSLLISPKTVLLSVVWCERIERIH